MGSDLVDFDSIRNKFEVARHCEERSDEAQKQHSCVERPHAGPKGERSE